MGDWDVLYIQQLSSKGYVYNISLVECKKLQDIVGVSEQW